MQTAVVDFGFGVLVGGLVLSACWGLFWLAIGSIGLARRTCSWRVVLNGTAVGGLPILMAWGLMWVRGGQGADSMFAAGLTVVPLVLTGLWLRRAPDGQPAGRHMLAGVRHLIDDLLGRHQGCGECGHEHDHKTGGCG